MTAAVSLDAVALEFRQDGKIGNAETAAELGRRGGIAKSRKQRLINGLGLRKIAEQASFAPYQDAADDFASTHREELARACGGQLDSGPSTMIATAALQLAASRWCFDEGAAAIDGEAKDPLEIGPTGYFKLGSSLGNDSRANLLAAYELATLEAKARAASKTETPMDAIRGRLGK